ncbi:iron-sulfur cluster repair di-iron protein [Bacillus pseudomycoides]|uniref:Iron-sulfur cluster repair di-iron protein n=1 Tax=Bacillus pseudomycoides TaxID=64104 RepID=A0AA91V8I2_9BACI|nr:MULTISPECIES: iron-sulfur cluster repair di-iron protein [Bacillus]PEB52324.1 iron-sulfur cluster repair di-iron protein [Bacillus sp. AFS098217]PED80369.1 iron-sulfur cluster repair di-iron protein [Bacillus pseudomycoides]PEU09553.1 iron-sulfur cluster repair di-iron protein [Bacillus sp. AFS014408]PEU12776.1 iron-sulfur cluster repair di-iron protein [Bacillus sp. AFS019443]PFW65102.1 iron-sulfur cluster repair di-iron protein [Bacillus sp. AFS075034]
MTIPFTKTSIVGEIVTVFPQSSDLFKKYRIDFCCGGDKTIEVATQTKEISSDELLKILNQQYTLYKSKNNESTNWSEVNLSTLIDHIIEKHHRFIQEELPQLSPYVTKVFRVHGQTESHLSIVHRLFHELKLELEQHIMKEETLVFPLIKTYEQNPTEENLVLAIERLEELEQEHDKAGDLIKELRIITNDFTPPGHACRTYRMVYNRLEDFESDLFQHVHLENNILFKRLLSLK